MSKNIFVSTKRAIVPQEIGSVNWSKYRPPKFQKNEIGEWASLAIPFWKKVCYIQFLVSEKEKKELTKMDAWKTTEFFIKKANASFTC